MGSLKAPGSDGFRALFFQNHWKVVGKDVYNFIRVVFQDPTKIMEVNQTFVTLISKKDEVSYMKDFRPISLCNVVYKVMMGLMTQHLRPVMGKLVGPFQSSFVPNCQSGDNIVLAQEFSFYEEEKRENWVDGD